MQTINYSELTKKAQKEIDEAYEEAGTPIARKSGNGYIISFIEDSLWDLFLAQRSNDIEKGIVKIVVFD